MGDFFRTNSPEVDVLIVGAGIAGLMAASCLIRLGFSIRIIDQTSGPTEVESVLVFQARTCEVLDQIGIVDQILAEAYTASAASFYENGQKKRTLSYPDTVDSEFPNLYIHSQASIENLYLGDLKKRGVEVSRFTRLVDFDIRGSNIATTGGLFIESGTYPIFARLTTIDGNSESIYAKYIIGADGAHSFVRKKLALDFKAVYATVREATIDIEYESDMPDSENIIFRNSDGSSTIHVPRGKRNGHWYARFFTYLPSPETSVSSSMVSEDLILEMVKQKLTPYIFNIKHIERFNAYDVTERVASSFDFANRIFLSGDSCHCHPTKGCMDLNLAITDSHNLCWKLFWHEKVRLGNSKLLDSYTIERRATAQGAIEITARVSQLIAGVADSIGLNSSFIKEINYIILKQDGFMHGCGITYDEGSAIMKESEVALGGNFKVVAGQRAPFGNLINADGESVRLYQLFTPDNVPSRFILLILLNSIAEHLDEFTLFTEWVKDFRSNLVDKTTIPVDSLLGVIVAQTELTETTLIPCNQVFHDKDGKLREKYGASDDEPAIFVIRPDQYIGAAWLLSETSGVEAYFRQILSI